MGAMHQTDGKPRGLAPAAVLAILLAGLLLGACGGSSESSSSRSASSRAAGKSGAAAKPHRASRAREAALRRCLHRNGITLPARPASRGAAGGPKPPKGVTRAQLRAAVKRCGGANLARVGKASADPRGPRRFTRYRKFAACMRAHGVNLPPPNTAGNGPIFNTKGLAANSSAFKRADAKCIHELLPQASAGAGGARGGRGGA